MVIPSPPTNVIVSVASATASVPVSPAMFNVVAIDTLAAEVIRPFESTANVGICDAPPYVPAETPVVFRLPCKTTPAVPSNATADDSTSSPLISKLRPLRSAVAVLALPYKDALTTVAEKLPEPSHRLR